MIPKQHEMDGIVKQIYEAMTTKEHLESTLLVLLGDHGMNDAGNHGGSAPGETSPALVFISPKLKLIGHGAKSPAEFQENFQYYYTVEQSDIAPTLGALLGFPVPRNNLGAFIPHFLPFWSSSRFLKSCQNQKILNTDLEQRATKFRSCFAMPSKFSAWLQLHSPLSRSLALPRNARISLTTSMSSHVDGEGSCRICLDLRTITRTPRHGYTL